MPPIALIGAGIAASAIGSGLSQRAANKGPRALFPGLQGTAMTGLNKVAGPGFDQLLSLIQTGNPVSTQESEQALAGVNKLQTQKGTAQLRERFGASGLSFSSPAAVGEADYLANQNANFMQLLANLRYQSATDAANREMMATEFGLSSLFGPAFTEVGPKGSVVGAVLGSAGGGLQQLALLQALGFGGGGSGGGITGTGSVPG